MQSVATTAIVTKLPPVPRNPKESNGLDKPGIKLIAGELGISASTVSRALRPETAHMVNPERRRQILELAEQMRFTPNPGARMLRKGINPSLTVVVPLEEGIFFSEFYGRFLAGTLHAAEELGWDIQIRTQRHRPDDAGIREVMQHMTMDTSGLIYLGEPLTHQEMEELRGFRRPLVIAKASTPPGSDVSQYDIDVVGADNVSGARLAVEHLAQLGHKSIGLLLGPATSRDAFERSIGYREAIAACGLESRPKWQLEVPFNLDGGRSAMERLLQTGSLPTAFCCASDEIAFGAVTAVQAAGMRCPEDVSIVGFDDGLWATLTRPALTTIRQPLAAMAKRAVSCIVKTSTSTEPVASGFDTMPTPLVVRDSTCAPA